MCSVSSDESTDRGSFAPGSASGDMSALRGLAHPGAHLCACLSVVVASGVQVAARLVSTSSDLLARDGVGVDARDARDVCRSLPVVWPAEVRPTGGRAVLSSCARSDERCVE